MTAGMTNRVRTERPAGLLALRALFLSMAVVLAMAVGLVAAGSALGLVALPYEMFELKLRTPVIFAAHMLSSGLALMLAPVVLTVRHRRDLHRPLGRLLGVFVVIGGLTALPVAAVSYSPPLARLGFAVQGLVWLALLGDAIYAVRAGNFSRHVTSMLAMVAVTSGAVWFRLITGTAIVMHWPFDEVYALAAWLGWSVPLIMVLFYRTRLTKAFVR